ncbi:MAG: UDP-galactopyranose mutase [Bacteroidales bacterium]|jgi:UDP-galactopyranose mutase|nr:UDP-galactopyranose mutase [Bacteroidales bacterium]
MYDIIIAGAGLYGAVFAHQAHLRGRKCLLVEKHPHKGGNLWCDTVDDIRVHAFGAHIFHTSSEEVWNYVNRFVRFNHYINSPVANFCGKLYNLPFNMNTFYQLWGVTTPAAAMAEIERQRRQYATDNPSNLEEMALSLAGHDIYYKLIKGYTEKQWGKPACQLPAFIIRRLPFRFTFDNNYFNDPFQGIPIGGYNPLIDALTDGIEVRLNTDFLIQKTALLRQTRLTVYTGEIDRYFDCCFGKLDYRSLRFEHEYMPDTANYQGNAVINYTDAETPYTRIIEHKHFEFGRQRGTVITREYPLSGNDIHEPYYPVNDAKNGQLFSKYQALAAADSHLHFGGRLGNYSYYNMDQVVAAAIADSHRLLD